MVDGNSIKWKIYCTQSRVRAGSKYSIIILCFNSDEEVEKNKKTESTKANEPLVVSKLLWHFFSTYEI